MSTEELDGPSGGSDGSGGSSGSSGSGVEGPDTTTPPPTADGRPRIRVRYQYYGPFPNVLEQMGCNLLVSTYQAGKLIAVGHQTDDLALSFHAFDQVMGIAAKPGEIAVGAREQVAFLTDNSQIARWIEPAGRFDRLFLHRSSIITGPIQDHELAWGVDEHGAPELWVVNTSFSCLCTLNPNFSFVPRWHPPFITDIREGDRCHLNGLGMRNGRPAVVTAMAASDQPGGWRADKNHTGRVLDVVTGEPITVGLAMPHSPRYHRDNLYVLNSGHGTFQRVDEATGERTTIVSLPGFTRGLALYRNLAFIGLSRIREKAVFGGVPLAARHEELRCGVAVVNLDTGTVVSRLEFEMGVEEIFDIQILPNATCTSLGGESPDTGDRANIWVIPPPPGKENTRLA